MENFDKTNKINEQDRKLLSDLSGKYDLGTQSIVDQEEYKQTLLPKWS